MGKCWRAALYATAAMVLAPQARALDPQQPVNSYLRTSFTTANGLPSDIVNGIAQSNGFLWLALPKWLVRFDGRRFLPIQLSPQPKGIFTVAAAKNGDLWLGVYGGVVHVASSVLDQTSTFPGTMYPLPGSVTQLHFERDGVLWAGGTRGLFRFDGRAFASVIPDADVSRIEEMKDGHLFVITGHGPVEWDGVRTIEHPEMASRFGGPRDIFHMYQDGQGTIWICSPQGLARVAGGRTDWFRVSGTDGKPQPAYRVFESSGGLWVAMLNGVYRVNGSALEPVTPAVDGRTFFEDRDGNLWIGSNAGGLTRLRDRLVHMFSQADGLPNEKVVTAVAAHDGTLWVSNNCGGISRFDGSRFHTYAERDGLVNSCVGGGMDEDRNHDLWMGTLGGGVFQFHEGKFTQYSKARGLPDDVVGGITATRDGSVWAVTRAGVSRIREGRIRNYTTADGLSDSVLLSIYEDRTGTIWAGNAVGLDRLEGDRFVNIARYENARLIRVAGEDLAGTLYVFTSLGMLRLAGGRLTGLMPEINGEGLFQYGQDLWIAGSRGLQRAPPDRLSKWETARDGPPDYVSYGLSDGFPVLAFNDRPVMTPDERLWMPTSRGLAMIDLAHLPRTTAKPQTYVSAITVDRRTRPPGGNLILPAGPHHVELDFDSLELTAPERTRLQYRLDGVDQEWFDAGPVHTAVYPSIPIGRHRFRVRASNRDGIWDREGIAYWIDQQPHYYETNLFRAGLIAIGLLMVAALYRLRLRQAAEKLDFQLAGKLAERERIARELHDTLMQTIQATKMIADSARHETADLIRQREAFETISEWLSQATIEARTALNALWGSTPPKNDLTEAFQQAAEAANARSSMRLTVSVQGSPQVLHPIVRDEVYRIGCEAVRNACQHSGASELAITLSYARNFTVRVQDNGKGLDPQLAASGKPGHFGLRVMRERAARIHGTLRILSRPEGGTEVELIIPGKFLFRESPAKPAWHSELQGILDRLRDRKRSTIDAEGESSDE